MSQPTDIVNADAAYTTPYYGVAPIVDDVNPAGQITVAGAGYNQTNPLYLNVGPRLDAGMTIPASEDDSTVHSNI